MLTHTCTVLVTHILPHKDHPSFSVKAFLERPHESRGVVAVWVPTERSLEFSLLKLFIQLTANRASTFSAELHLSNLVSGVCVVYCPASSKTQPSQTKQSLNSRFLNPLPPLNTQAGRIMQTNLVQRRHRDVSIIHHLHSEENEGGGAGGSSSVPQA